MFRLVLLILLSDGAILSTSEEAGPTVQTSLGSILGTIQKSRKGIDFYSFRGIRYAKDPIGEMRFKPPMPEEAWSGIMNATVDGPDCHPSYQSVSDCLRLNVYTQRINDVKENRPVLVYIHSGYFNSGTASSDILGPEYLMDHDIVVITINYRLATLGFFSTADKHAPGNYGMKDQVEALKWVKNNIQFFGGDPNKVTIAGKNAGGASVGLHLVSPMSRGLFHGAIMLSGSATNPWVIDKNPMKRAKKEAGLHGCPTEDSEKMIECMTGIPTYNITSISNQLRGWNGEGRMHSPVIEVEVNGQERFLDQDPLVSLIEGNVADVPVFIGTTRYEETSKALRAIRQGKDERELSQNWAEIIPIICQYEKDDNVSNKLREFYFEEKPINYNSADNLIDLLSDALIIQGVIQSAKLISKKNTKPVYLYQYNYMGEGLQHFLRAEMADKVANSLDTYYIFRNMIPMSTDERSEDGWFITKITTLWKNFIETGNPTPTPSPVLDNVAWERYTNDNPKYLDLNEPLKLVNGIYFEKRISFWENLFPLPEKV